MPFSYSSGGVLILPVRYASSRRRDNKRDRHSKHPPFCLIFRCRWNCKPFHIGDSRTPLTSLLSRRSGLLLGDTSHVHLTCYQHVFSNISLFGEFPTCRLVWPPRGRSNCFVKFPSMGSRRLLRKARPAITITQNCAVSPETVASLYSF